MHGNDTRRRTDVAVPLLRFALAGLLAVVIVGAIAVALQRNAAHDDAVQDAKTLAKLARPAVLEAHDDAVQDAKTPAKPAGHAVLEPNVNRPLLDGDPQQLAFVDSIVKSKVLTNDGIVRIKLWDRTGRIVYSDRRSLINKRFALPEDEREAFETGKVNAELTNLSRAENRFDGLHGKLLEVYLPITSTDGQTLLFELYQRQASVT